MSEDTAMEILELKQAARKLHGTLFFVRSLIASGDLPYLKIGKKFCVTQTDLDAWIAANRERRSTDLLPPQKTRVKRVQRKREVTFPSVSVS